MPPRFWRRRRSGNGGPQEFQPSGDEYPVPLIEVTGALYRRTQTTVAPRFERTNPTLITRSGDVSHHGRLRNSNPKSKLDSILESKLGHSVGSLKRHCPLLTFPAKILSASPNQPSLDIITPMKTSFPRPASLTGSAGMLQDLFLDSIGRRAGSLNLELTLRGKETLNEKERRLRRHFGGKDPEFYEVWKVFCGGLMKGHLLW